MARGYPRREKWRVFVSRRFPIPAGTRTQLRVSAQANTRSVARESERRRTHAGCNYVKRARAVSLFCSGGARRAERAAKAASSRIRARNRARRDETRSVATRPPGKHDDRFLHPALPCPALPNPTSRHATLHVNRWTCRNFSPPRAFPLFSLSLLLSLSPSLSLSLSVALFHCSCAIGRFRG